MIRRALLCLSALGAGLTGPAAIAQVEPKSPVHVTLNGVFYLCPDLVRTGAAPNTERLSQLGFTPSDPIVDEASRSLWFKSLDKSVALAVSYDPDKRQCFFDYGGAGYQAIAGIVRDTVTNAEFKRITGGDEGGAKADVFEGRVPNKALIARVIIIENYTKPSAAISYSERAGS